MDDRHRARWSAPWRGLGPSTPALVGKIGSHLVQLAQTEVDLARAELASDVGLTLLLVAAVLALAALMPGWLAALLVAAVVCAVGATAGYIGWRHRPRSPLALTRTSPKEGWEWLKEQVA